MIAMAGYLKYKAGAFDSLSSEPKARVLI
jgi:hypothetical protein